VTKKSTESVAASSATWETLEAFTRRSVQELLQRMLEEEVDGLLARGRYERRAAIDAPVGYRNAAGRGTNATDDPASDRVGFDLARGCIRALNSGLRLPDVRAMDLILDAGRPISQLFAGRGTCGRERSVLLDSDCYDRGYGNWLPPGVHDADTRVLGVKILALVVMLAGAALFAVAIGATIHIRQEAPPQNERPAQTSPRSADPGRQ